MFRFVLMSYSRPQATHMPPQAEQYSSAVDRESESRDEMRGFSYHSIRARLRFPSRAAECRFQ
jgi:hypothetical protein